MSVLVTLVVILVYSIIVVLVKASCLCICMYLYIYIYIYELWSLSCLVVYVALIATPHLSAGHNVLFSDMFPA